MAPYPTARRVKKVVNCIFVLVIFLLWYKLSEASNFS